MRDDSRERFTASSADPRNSHLSRDFSLGFQEFRYFDFNKLAI
jgi:hypothetical protein